MLTITIYLKLHSLEHEHLSGIKETKTNTRFQVSSAQSNWYLTARTIEKCFFSSNVDFGARLSSLRNGNSTEMKTMIFVQIISFGAKLDWRSFKRWTTGCPPKSYSFDSLPKPESYKLYYYRWRILGRYMVQLVQVVIEIHLKSINTIWSSI